MPDVIKKYGAEPFQEAVDFFTQKVDLPTERWDDLWQGQHARGFMVAGAMRSDLLIDLRGAVEKAITQGETLEDFRKRFDAIVEKHGWVYKGGRNWRTKVIYDTNLRQAYNTGRYRQMSDPDVIALRPYLLYRHGDSRNPRPQHLAWDGLVLRHDDPFWNTHKPQNGWGCKCKVFSVSDRDLKRIGKSGPDPSPKVETYEYKNPQTGAVEKVPLGIDPGFDYDPGKAAWGKRLTEKQMDAWRAKGETAWERLTPGSYTSLGRSETIPIDPPVATVNKSIGRTVNEMAQAIQHILGGPGKVFRFEKDGFSWGVSVNAETLAAHIDPSRAQYIPFLQETLSDPYEIWMTFERHADSGKIELRQRIIKGVEMGNNNGMLIVTNVVDGMIEAWTMIPVRNMNYLNKQRSGKLIWHRD